MAQPEQSKPTIIFSGDFHRAAVIKNMLENHGIYVFIQNEHMGSIAPFQVASGGFNPVRLIISGHDEEEAQRLLDGFDAAAFDNQDEN
ncbi:DUF2007 domain-containing protein [Pontibacter sp. FD36]|uniref:putative signal transducing protein n=1 Tax=Pontibacter sp. FD36 TaxID=2789860 RepID=UPI0018AC2761|nr:DUF2007 domain-containing protein [Pontibacter sp. FD36]MBF8964384.1 DUF2007 domain-containing protein [Pontibacter sp. FD36]